LLRFNECGWCISASEDMARDVGGCMAYGLVTDGHVERGGLL